VTLKIQEYKIALLTTLTRAESSDIRRLWTMRSSREGAQARWVERLGM